MSEPRFLAVGDTALSVEFGEAIDRQVSDRVLALDRRLAAEPAPGMIETVPTFRALMIHYDPCAISFGELVDHVGQHLAGLSPRASAARIWEIPACYEGECAPDLTDVAARTGLGEDEIVALHTGQSFHVYMIGFLPGLPYMGDLPAQISLPRRENPRLRLPPGSVAITGTMTTIYPVQSPGGWHLIGNTPVPLFDLASPTPALLAPGDQVQFSAIDGPAFAELKAEIEAGRYRPVCRQAPS